MICLFIGSCKKQIPEEYVIRQALEKYCLGTELSIDNFNKPTIYTDHQYDQHGYDWCVEFTTKPEQNPQHILLIFGSKNRILKQQRMIESRK